MSERKDTRDVCAAWKGATCPVCLDLAADVCANASSYRAAGLNPPDIYSLWLPVMLPRLLLAPRRPLPTSAAIALNPGNSAATYTDGRAQR